MTGADTQRGVILRLNTLFLRYLPFSFIIVDLLNGEVLIIIVIIIINRSDAPTIFLMSVQISTIPFPNYEYLIIYT